ncbi:MAG: BREX-1 system phosphatase PglZ type A, partial [Nitrospiraceae bacterium]|nr:BREX-1 system phosphatase PglZ type A [Nitrospiraceae bacterium]
VSSQGRFYDQWVKPFLKHDKKVFIIISDAMRFEIGDSLLSRIRQEDRYDAVLNPVLASLPSITKIGMAALLPHDELTMVDQESEGTLLDGISSQSAANRVKIIVDGISSQGTANRAKILDQALPGRATAIKAEELLGMDRERARDLTRKHQVVYVYHNEIDATGDNRESEQRVFEAVDKTLDTLLAVIKKLAGANANNLLVTADHGFLYQAGSIDESDFIDTVENSGGTAYRGRRCIIGKNLPANPALKTFHASDVGLRGDMQVQIPKSINRLRLKGSGSRFVHGGAALQEVVIPVLRINKKRRSDLSRVNVDILAGETSVITSGQLSVKFYQTVPASDKVRPCGLRAGIYTQDGQLISDLHNLVFDSESDSAREREKEVQFILTRDADEANDQQVVLRLEERVEGTTHYRVYKTATYQLRRSFTTDFDF